MGGSPDTLVGSDFALVPAAALCSALACCFSNRRPEDALSNNSRSDSVILEAASEAAEVSEEEVEEEEEEDEEESESLDELPEICKWELAVKAQTPILLCIHMTEGARKCCVMSKNMSCAPLRKPCLAHLYGTPYQGAVLFV